MAELDKEQYALRESELDRAYHDHSRECFSRPSNARLRPIAEEVTAEGMRAQSQTGPGSR